MEGDDYSNSRLRGDGRECQNIAFRRQRLLMHIDLQNEQCFQMFQLCCECWCRTRASFCSERIRAGGWFLSTGIFSGRLLFSSLLKNLVLAAL
jgi:hypothetical protein